MPKSCRAPNCSNAAGQPRPPCRRLSFYKFPLRDAARLRQWLARMGVERWVPSRHQHLCSDHFEPSCFQYRWGVRYLRPDAVPTIFPRGPAKQKTPKTPPGPAQPEQPLPQAAAPPRGEVPGGPAPPPAAGGEAPRPPLEPVPRAPPGEPSTQELLRVVLGLQRKLKVLQQRHRRHRARLQAMEGLLQRLRRHSPGARRGLRLACLQPGPEAPDAAVAIICQEEEEEEEEEEAAAPLVYSVPPQEGAAGGQL